MFLNGFNQELHDKTLIEQGIELGLKQGLADNLRNLAELVNEGYVPYDVALAKAGVPEEEFKQYL